MTPTPSAHPPPSRTLLLAPPSIASHETILKDVFANYERSTTDLQMLDRLSAGLVSLPASTYDLILILADADSSQSTSAPPLDRDLLGKIFAALQPGGKLQSQNRKVDLAQRSVEHKEAILAGLILEGKNLVKPLYRAGDTVPLRLLRRKKEDNVVETGIDGDDDDDDNDLIDEDTLLTEEEQKRPLNIPAECTPRVGKRRRACKDCTCGLAEKLAAEDAAKRSAADNQLRALKLGGDELSEIDFTVKGKIGSCGNCSLGDAFRCEGCPYIGMPAFKPGEEVRLINSDSVYSQVLLPDSGEYGLI
ncbi:hypothetical protein K3495_g3398 [Podosphaera aphanis]|nr:hypothetical protein K3495_g3398 [Podosphaera aphanis]